MEDYSADIIVLLDEDDKEHEFEILDKIEHDGEMFYALTPYDPDLQSDDEEEPYFIMQEVNGEEGLELVEVADETLLDFLAEKFRQSFDDKFGEC